MTFTKLKEAVVGWANSRRGDEFYTEDVVKQFKISQKLAVKVICALHKEGQVVHADGCDKCDA